MRFASVKQFCRVLHRVLGLSVGLWAAAIALSGSLLVFSHEIDAALNPHLLRVEVHARAWNPDDAVATVRQQFPHAPLVSMRLPRRDDESLLFRMGKEGSEEVYLDPYTSRVLGTRDEHDGLVGFLRNFHVHLLAGETGETISGYLALLLISIVATGIALWWPRRGRLANTFKIRWRLPMLPRMYDLHRVAGAASALFLLVPVITGTMLVFHQVTTSFLITSLGGPTLSLPDKVTMPAEASREPVSAWLTSARNALPGAELVSVKFPQTEAEPAVVRMRFPTNTHPNGRSFVAIDPYTSQVLHAHDWRQIGTGLGISDYKYPLHIGTAFSLPGRLAVLLIGTVPLLLLATGWYIWWRKRQPATGSVMQTGRLPARTGLTGKPPVAGSRTSSIRHPASLPED
ncbi:PepSY-associated TM helix domain-containing protein [Pseudaminobacter sp. NGMCC 1.201702]|uniref:PepSY-associated TM helix domain-containing protein n=1 Tax=Pseudaminobacter sp. NGMCC 1.201702 TaxID=3391825 RepID=UPI0039EF7A8A